jgi:hypothetical protein
MNSSDLQPMDMVTEISNRRRRRLLVALLAVGILPGCGGSSSREANGELTGKVASADLPAQSEWSYGSPFDAIVAGTDVDGYGLRVCRAEYQGGVHPGKTRADRSVCYVGWGGREIPLSTYQTLRTDWTWAWSGAVPDSAVEFGCEQPGWLGGCGAMLYPCRAYFGGGLHPGKIRPGFDGCYIPYGGSEIHVASYEVLLGTVPVEAVAVTPGAPLPAEAVVGGYDIDGTPLYPCSAPFQGGIHPGKTRADWGTCDVSWGGGEHWIASFNVLVPKFMDPWHTEAYAAGHEANGDWLGVCRSSYGGSLQVGKFVSWAGSCNFGFYGNEVAVWSGFPILGSPPPPK